MSSRYVYCTRWVSRESQPGSPWLLPPSGIRALAGRVHKNSCCQLGQQHLSAPFAAPSGTWQTGHVHVSYPRDNAPVASSCVCPVSGDGTCGKMKERNTLATTRMTVFAKWLFLCQENKTRFSRCSGYNMISRCKKKKERKKRTDTEKKNRHKNNTVSHGSAKELKWKKRRKGRIAEDGFDPSTSGLWAQHAPAAPLCYLHAGSQIFDHFYILKIILSAPPPRHLFSQICIRKFSRFLILLLMLLLLYLLK